MTKLLWLILALTNASAYALSDNMSQATMYVTNPGPRDIGKPLIIRVEMKYESGRVYSRRKEYYPEAIKAVYTAYTGQEEIEKDTMGHRYTAIQISGKVLILKQAFSDESEGIVSVCYLDNICLSDKGRSDLHGERLYIGKNNSFLLITDSDVDSSEIRLKYFYSDQGEFRNKPEKIQNTDWSTLDKLLRDKKLTPITIADNFQIPITTTAALGF